MNLRKIKINNDDFLNILNFCSNTYYDDEESNFNLIPEIPTFDQYTLSLKKNNLNDKLRKYLFDNNLKKYKDYVFVRSFGRKIIIEFYNLNFFDLNLEEIYLNFEIVFLECLFMNLSLKKAEISYIKIESCDLSNLVFEEDCNIKEFKLDNSQITNIIMNEDNNFEGIIITNQNKISKIEFDCKVETIEIKNKNVIKELILSDDLKVVDLDMFGNNFIDIINVNRGDINNFWIKDNNLFKEINISRLTGICLDFNNINCDSLEINFVEIENLYLRNFSIKKLEIKNSKFKNSFNLNLNQLSENNNIDEFLFIHNDFMKFIVNNVSFKLIEIHYISIQSNAEFVLGNIIIKNKKFILSNIQNKGLMRLYDINYCVDLSKKGNKASIVHMPQRFSSDGEPQIPEVFAIFNSNLGNAQLQNLNLVTFQFVIIESTILDESKLFNIIWPYNHKIFSFNEYSTFKAMQNEEGYNTKDFSKCNEVNFSRGLGSALEESKVLVDTYNQLKKAISKQEEPILSLEFYKKELEANLIHLKHAKNNSIKINFIDYFILWFNKYSNDFGLNWLRPLLLMILVNLVFFILFMFFNGWTFNLSLKTFGDNLGYFAELFIITNSLEKVFSNSSFNGIWVFINFIKNILLSVLLFQTIVAFRKFSKKL